VLLVAGAAALAASAPGRARAQVCCAAPNLATPARLQRNESWGVGAHARGRGVFGAFGADGAFAGTSHGDVETEQDLFGAVQLASRLQLALVVPFVQTRRQAPGLSEWGGGVGDVRASARIEILRDGAHGPVPGVALVAGVALPTGTPPEAAGDVLAAGATGTGTTAGTLGVELERRFERVFATLAGGIVARAPRTVGDVRQSFGLEVTALASGGTVVADDVAVGGFVAASRQGASRDGVTGRQIPDSALALVTFGAATAFPITEGWRGQGIVSVDCPVSGLGRNRNAGAGLGLSLLRVWP
jgi:hypothetical protein